MSEYTGRTLEKSAVKKVDIGAVTIILVTAFLFILLSITTKTFLSYDNLYSIFFGESIQFYAIIGFTFLMIMGEIDMSVGSMYGFGGAMLGLLTVIYKIPFLPSLIITLAISALIGLITGFLVVKFRVNSMMVTIGVMTAVKGFNWLLINKLQARVFPASFRNFMKFKIDKIHWTIIAFFILVIILEILLYRTTVFKKMYYVGQNIISATIYGIKANRIKMLAFTSSALLASFGGILATSRIAHADVTTGDGLEFTIVTAAVLGGASLFGGRGSILRSALGLFFLAMMQNGMISFRIDPFIQKIVLGIILILSVLIDIRLNKRKA